MSIWKDVLGFDLLGSQTTPTPPRLPQPVRPQLTPLQILSLAQLYHDYPELALEMATDYGRRPLEGQRK